MKEYISLLRGINVGGNRIIKMADLKSLLQKDAIQEVQTYIQSGNIFIRSKDSTAEETSQIIKTSIKDKYDYDVPTITLEYDAFLEISEKATNYYPEDYLLKHIQLTFTSSPIQEKDLHAILKSKNISSDAWVINNNVIVQHCPDGYLKTKVTHAFIEKYFNIQATTRNLKTTQKILTLKK